MSARLDSDVQMPFPISVCPGRQHERTNDGYPVLHVRPAVVADLDIDPLAAYVTALMWSERGEVVSLARLIVERFHGDEGRAVAAVSELFASGYFVDPDQHRADADRRARDFAEAMYGDRSLPQDWEPGGPNWYPAAHEPNGPDGTWAGSWPYDEADTIPDLKQNVVYVGSTCRFRTRMRDHAKKGKMWARWTAYPCVDRAEAYDVEARFLRQFMPSLNRQGAQSRGGAK